MKHDPMLGFDGKDEDDCRHFFDFGSVLRPDPEGGDSYALVAWQLCRSYINLARRVEQLETTLNRTAERSLKADLEIDRLKTRLARVDSRTSGLTLIGKDVNPYDAGKKRP
jgi:hypothetical protein